MPTALGRGKIIHEKAATYNRATAVVREALAREKVNGLFGKTGKPRRALIGLPAREQGFPGEKVGGVREIVDLKCASRPATASVVATTRGYAAEFVKFKALIRSGASYRKPSRL